MGDEERHADEDHEPDHGAGSGHAKPADTTARVIRSHDQRNAQQHGDRRQRAQVVDGVERRVDLLGDHDRTDGQAETADERHERQAQTVRHRRLAGRNSGVDQPELLALLPLLHALRQLRIVVALHQRGVVFTGRIVVARELAHCFFALGRVLDTSDVAGERVAEALFLVFEDIQIALDLRLALLDA